MTSVIDTSRQQNDLSVFFAESCIGIRKHAPYFALSADKQENEVDVACMLRKEMLRRGKESYHSIRSRGPGNDPPDCEATGNSGERVGIEVTELVEESAIQGAIKGTDTHHEPIAPLAAVKRISDIIKRKDRADIRGEQYDLYILVIYCGDPYFLIHDVLVSIREARFQRTRLIDRAYFLESYNPWQMCCPYVELSLSADSSDGHR